MSATQLGVDERSRINTVLDECITVYKDSAISGIESVDVNTIAARTITNNDIVLCNIGKRLVLEHMSRTLSYSIISMVYTGSLLAVVSLQESLLDEFNGDGFVFNTTQLNSIIRHCYAYINATYASEAAISSATINGESTMLYIKEIQGVVYIAANINLQSCISSTEVLSRDLHKLYKDRVNGTIGDSDLYHMIARTCTMLTAINPRIVTHLCGLSIVLYFLGNERVRVSDAFIKRSEEAHLTNISKIHISMYQQMHNANQHVL